jgi:hypothetical protein
VFSLPTPVASIWETPLRHGRIILLFDQLHARLLLSDEGAAEYAPQGGTGNAKQPRRDFLLNTDIQYLLKSGSEYVVQVRSKATNGDSLVCCFHDVFIAEHWLILRLRGRRPVWRRCMFWR